MEGDGNVWKGLVAGAAGGLVASAVMNQFQALLSKLVIGEERSHGAQSLQPGAPDHGIGRELQERGIDDEDDDAAMRLANAISDEVLDHQLTKQEKHAAGAAVHYAFGITTGAWYGAAAELIPAVTTGVGVPFGTFVWLTADEGVVPAVGLSRSAGEYPLAIHACALASHFVYGLTAELVRRALRRTL
jgi:hypothetical protein